MGPLSAQTSYVRENNVPVLKKIDTPSKFFVSVINVILQKFRTRWQCSISQGLTWLMHFLAASFDLQNRQ